MSRPSSTRRNPGSTVAQKFVTRGIPLVSLALGAAGCETEEAFPFLSGDTGTTTRDTGTGSTDTGTGDRDTGTTTRDTGGTTTDTGTTTRDTGGTTTDTGTSTDTGGTFDSGLGTEADAVIARFCAAASACIPDYSDCASETSSTVGYAQSYGAGCYNAFLTYLDLLSEGSCESYTNEYGTYNYLSNPAIDPRDVAIGCTSPTGQEQQIAAAFCSNAIDCAGTTGQQYACEADILWYLEEDPAYATYFECMANAACVDGELDYTECYEG